MNEHPLLTRSGEGDDGRVDATITHSPHLPTSKYYLSVFCVVVRYVSDLYTGGSQGLTFLDPKMKNSFLLNTRTLNRDAMVSVRGVLGLNVVSLE